MSRSWLQLHLSTAIILVFVAGILLWANTRPFKFVKYDAETRTMYYRWSGWPIASQFEWQRPIAQRGVVEDVAAESIKRWNDRIQSGVFQMFGSWSEILFNTLIAILILGIVAKLCEHVVEKRSR